MLNTLYIHKRYLTIREDYMTTEKRSGFTVISNNDLKNDTKVNVPSANGYHTNPMYEKLMTFRNLQEQQKKRFSVEDFLRSC